MLLFIYIVIFVFKIGSHQLYKGGTYHYLRLVIWKARDRMANHAAQGHADQVSDSQILNPAALISSSL